MSRLLILSQRARRVLLYLCRSKEPVSCSQIAAYLGISARSVRYDLDSVEVWLRGSPTRLVRRRGVGVVLEGDTEHIPREMEGTDGSQCYLSRADRAVGIAGRLLWQSGFVAACELARKFGVSANAIYACLNEVSLWLAKRKLVLVRKSGAGLGVRGNEMFIRQAMAEILWERSDVHTFPDLPEIGGSGLPMERVRQMLEDVLRSMKRPYSSHALVSLTVHMLVSNHRLRMGNQVALEPSLIALLKQEEEWPVAVQVARRSEGLLDVCFSEQEQAYMALCLCTARLGEEVDTLPSALSAYRDLHALDAAYLVSAGVTSICGIELKNDPLLIADLATHLRASLYILRSGLHKRNRYLDDIKRYYPSVFRATASACQPLERIYHVKMTEEEVGWIAFHMAAALQRAKTRSGARYRAVLVFPDRRCLARMLVARLAAEFPEVEMVATVPPGALKSSLKALHPDFVILHDYMDAVPGRAIIVNPLLPLSDVRAMRKLLNSVRLLKHGEDLEIHADSWKGGGRPPLFRHARVATLNVRAADRADAISQGCSYLASMGTINSRYRSQALENAAEFDSYTVVAPGLSVPHARPSDGINTNFALVMTLEEPVMFGSRSFDPVRVVILWGATDERRYAAFMDDILSLLRDTLRLKRLVSATTPDDVRSALGWAASGAAQLPLQ